MNVTIWPSELLISSRTALSRSSNSPRYLAPATIEARSRAIRVLPRRLSGTSPATIRWARPSTTAVLPTPGSPMMHGVVLGPAAQHLDDAADLGVAADHRVQLAGAGDRGEVGAVLLQRLEGVFGVRRCPPCGRRGHPAGRRAGPRGRRRRRASASRRRRFRPTRTTTSVNRNVAAVLGKALFWDMQVGSDGVQACGTCHFTGAGIDTRTKNQINPNHLGGDFTLRSHAAERARPHRGTTSRCTSSRTPTSLATRLRAGDPRQRERGARWTIPSPAITSCATPATSSRDVNDVVSSMGVVFDKFSDIAPIGQFRPGRRRRACRGARSSHRRRQRSRPDPGLPGLSPGRAPQHADDAGGRVQLRQLLGRARAPRLQRRQRVRRRRSPGPRVRDRSRRRHRPAHGDAADHQVREHRLAGDGPGFSEFEMSFLGRNWAKLGKKLLQAGVTPLANQLVDATDSVLGPYSNQNGGSAACRPCSASIARQLVGTSVAGKPGLCISYRGLIRRAFFPRPMANVGSHLVGCYTDGDADAAPEPVRARHRSHPHPRRMAPSSIPRPIRSTTTCSRSPAARCHERTPTSSRTWRATSACSGAWGSTCGCSSWFRTTRRSINSWRPTPTRS